MQAESASLDTRVVMAEPEVEIRRPKTQATITTSESGSEVVATLTESEGRTHIASMRRDEGLSADALGIELPQGAKRLAGADLTKLESASAAYQGLSGSKGVVYEVAQPASKVLGFYRDHPSGRFEVFDRDAMKDLGLTSTDGDATVVMALDDPTRAIAVQAVEDKLTRLVIVDLSGSALGAGDSEEGPG